MPQPARQTVWNAFHDRFWALIYVRGLAGFPWFWPAHAPGHRAMVAARRLSRRRFGADHRRGRRLLARVLTALAWVPSVLVHLGHIRWHEGSAVPLRRMPGAFWVAMRNNVQPIDYFAYRLWQPEARRNIDNYLYNPEMGRVFKAINRPASPDPIDDKLAFHDLCTANGIPTPKVLAALSPEAPEPDLALPQQDLFVKPRFGASGFVRQRWTWTGVDYRDAAGQRVAADDLVHHLAQRVRADRRARIIQPFVSNHPTLPTLSPDVLCPVRVVTGRGVDGAIVPVFSTFHLARYLDDRTWPFALVDLTDGRLVGSTERPHAVLPDFQEALALAVRSHALCAGIVFVGWDVALTPGGPMMLEGNLNWNPREFQSAAGALSKTVFADVLATHLVRLGAIKDGRRSLT